MWSVVLGMSRAYEQRQMSSLEQPLMEVGEDYNASSLKDCGKSLTS